MIHDSILQQVSDLLSCFSPMQFFSLDNITNLSSR